MKEFILSNGVKAPALAYGTWLIKNENAANCVKMALEAGYRHIDTAKPMATKKALHKVLENLVLKEKKSLLPPKSKRN